MRWSMTPIARQSCVLAFQKVSRLFVVEVFRVPFDEREVFTIVLRVASRAFLAGTRWDAVAGMQSSMCGEPGGDFCMAFETLQGRLSAKLVATRTICRSVQRLMGSCEGTGRDLRTNCRKKKEQCYEQREKNETMTNHTATLAAMRDNSVYWRFWKLTFDFRLAAQHAPREMACRSEC